MRPKTRAAIVGVIAVLVLAGCGSVAPSGSSPATTGPPATIAPTPTELPASYGDLGATITQFSAVHRRDVGPGVICTADYACYGASFMNDDSAPTSTYAFTLVSVDAGIVDGYQMNFPNDTSVVDAKAQVLAWLPRDVTVTYFGVDHNNGSCGQWNLQSPTLARVFGSPKIGDPQGDVGVDFSNLDASGTPAYSPSNVQDAIVSILPGSPTFNC